MKKILSVFAQVAMFCLGVALFAGSLWLLVRFFTYGDDHPLNGLLGVFGVAPVMLNIADMSTLDSSTLEIISSILSACAIYVSLAGFAIVASNEASLLIAAGGLKNYRALPKAKVRPIGGFLGAFLQMQTSPVLAEDPAAAAIQFALDDDDGMQFLRLWNQGDFDVIRREWPEAPESVFIGADQLHKPSK